MDGQRKPSSSYRTRTREQPSFWSTDFEPYPPLSVRHGSRGNVLMKTDMTFHGTDDNYIDCQNIFRDFLEIRRGV